MCHLNERHSRGTEASIGVPFDICIYMYIHTHSLPQSGVVMDWQMEADGTLGDSF